MKIASILLPLALAAVLATASLAASEVTSQGAGSHASGSNHHSKLDIALSSHAGSFGGRPFGHPIDGSRGGGGAPFDRRGSKLRHGSGSRFADTGSLDGSHGSGFSDRLHSRHSGSHGGHGSGSVDGSRRGHFRGDVGDDYDYGFGDDSDDSDDSFDASGSGGSSSSDFRHHHRHHGRKPGSAAGSHALDDYDVGQDESSGSLGLLHSHGVRPPCLPRGSGSGASHKLRDSAPDHAN